MFYLDKNTFRIANLKINNFKFVLVLSFAFVLCSNNLYSQTTPKKIATDSVKTTPRYLFNNIRFDSVSIDIKEALFKEMGEYTISSGYIILSGAGYYSPKMMSVSGNFNLFPTSDLRIVAGTRLTLDKCVLKSKEGKTMMLTKSFFFR